MVARKIPVLKVACSIHVGVISQNKMSQDIILNSKLAKACLQLKLFFLPLFLNGVHCKDKHVCVHVRSRSCVNLDSFFALGASCVRRCVVGM